MRRNYPYTHRHPTKLAEPTAESGWELCGICATPPPNRTGVIWQQSSGGHPTTACGQATSCLRLQAKQNPLFQEVLPSHRGMKRHWEYINSPISGVRGAVWVQYRRTVTGPTTWTEATNLPYSPTVYTPRIEIPAQAFPDIGTPQVQPHPPSRPRISPELAPIAPGIPHGQPRVPRTYPRTPVRTRPELPKQSDPDIGPKPGIALPRPTPRPEPQPQLEIPPKGPPRYVRNDHRQAPPRKRERERKVNSRSAGVAASVYDAITEGADFVDALHKSLPKHLRRGRSLSGKMADIYEHYDRLDPSEAIRQLLINQIEDKFIGRTIATSRKGYRKGMRDTIGDDVWSGSKLGGLSRAASIR